MKKILVSTAIILGLIAGYSFAEDLESNLETTDLSASVNGTYWANNSNSTFLMSTWHLQGTKAFATGSEISKVYYNECAEEGACKSSDALNSTPSSYNSTELSSWTVMGE